MQLVVPKGLQQQIMQGAHDDVLAGHLGVAKTYEVIRQRFYWFNICFTISNIIATFNMNWYILF